MSTPELTAQELSDLENWGGDTTLRLLHEHAALKAQVLELVGILTAEQRRLRCTPEERAIIEATEEFPDERFEIAEEDQPCEGARFCAAVLAMRKARRQAARCTG